MCWTVWTLWSMAMRILPSLKSGFASRSWPPRQLVAVLLDWTVTPSANKPVKDQWGGGGPGSWPFLSSDENNEDPASQPADREQWLRRWCGQLWGNVLTQTIGLWMWKGFGKTQPTDFTFSSSSFACTKTCISKEAYIQISLKGLFQQLK